jgi:hypothetical protein
MTTAPSLDVLCGECIRHERSTLRGVRGVRVLAIDERLSTLPSRCRDLELGLYNDENDPDPLFRDLPYAGVMAIALRDPVVARVLTRLPSSWRWPDE